MRMSEMSRGVPMDTTIRAKVPNLAGKTHPHRAMLVCKRSRPDRLEAIAMTTIKATCPECGDVDLRPREISVVVAPAAGWATYEFVCPECNKEITKSADEEVVTLLRGAGVTVERLHVPAEALEMHFGNPISHDDLIDFGLTLRSTDRLIQVLSRETSAGL